MRRLIISLALYHERPVKYVTSKVSRAVEKYFLPQHLAHQLNDLPFNLFLLLGLVASFIIGPNVTGREVFFGTAKRPTRQQFLTPSQPKRFIYYTFHSIKSKFSIAGEQPW
jgi:hypothetical protein